MLNTDPVEFWKKWKTFGDTCETDSIPNADGDRWGRYFQLLVHTSAQNPTYQSQDTTRLEREKHISLFVKISMK